MNVIRTFRSTIKLFFFVCGQVTVHTDTYFVNIEKFWFKENLYKIVFSMGSYSFNRVLKYHFCLAR